MANPFFHFKQFSVLQEKCAMKVGTDGVLLGAWVNCKSAASILDIGTGTGLLALMMAQSSQASIHAIDIEEGAWLQAIANVRQCLWADRIQVIHKSLQDYQGCGRKYDLIVSNPPFFENSLKSPGYMRTMARHTDFLPMADLLTGVSGLLETGGRFCLILPYVEAQLFIVDAAFVGLFCWRKTDVRPSPFKKVNRVMMEFSTLRQKLKVDTLCIRGNDGEYSADYKELTKAYYLNF